jgi:hypothetical protein
MIGAMHLPALPCALLAALFPVGLRVRVADIA